LVLGCTHYPLIKEVLKEVFPQATLVDSAQAVATLVKRLLPSVREGSRGEVKILVSDKTERFVKIAQLIMGEPVEIEEVKVDKE